MSSKKTLTGRVQPQGNLSYSFSPTTYNAEGVDPHGGFDPTRHKYVDLKNTEPMLGVPPFNNYVLASTRNGERYWVSNNPKSLTVSNVDFQDKNYYLTFVEEAYNDEQAPLVISNVTLTFNPVDNIFSVTNLEANNIDVFGNVSVTDTISTSIANVTNQAIINELNVLRDALIQGNLDVRGELLVTGEQNTLVVNETELNAAPAILTLANNNISNSEEFIGLKAKISPSGPDPHWVWDRSDNAWFAGYSVDTVNFTLSDIKFDTARGDLIGNVTGAHFGPVTGDVVGDLTGNVAGQVSDISNHSTTDLVEGANLYFTEERVDDRVANLFVAGLGIDITYNDINEQDGNGNIVISVINPVVVTSLVAGNGLISTDTINDIIIHVGPGRGIIANPDNVEVNFDDFSTTDLVEGNNLYYTNARVNAYIQDNNISFDKDIIVAGDVKYGTLTDSNDYRMFNFSDNTSLNDANSSNIIPSQYSVKTYVDNTFTSATLTVGNSAITTDIDLDSETLTIRGTANEIDVFTSTNTLTVGLPNDVDITRDLSVGRDLTVSGNATIDDALVVTNGPVTLNGATSADDMTLSGNLTVNGDNVTLSALNVADSIIVLNSGQSPQTSGIQVDRGGINDVFFRFNQSNTRWELQGPNAAQESLYTDGTITAGGFVGDSLVIGANNALVANTLAGRVGINTGNPVTTFEVSNTLQTYAQITATGPNSVAGIALKNDAQEWTIRTVGSDSDKLHVRDSTAGENRITITSSGLIGIKQSDPEFSLDVNGTAAANALNIRTTQGNISIANGASALSFERSGPNYIRATGESGSFRFITGADDYTTDRLTISTNGDISFFNEAGNVIGLRWDAGTQRLGIGTTSPTTMLDVSGTTKTDDLIVDNNVSISSYGVIIDSTGKWIGDPTGLQGPQGTQGIQGIQGTQGIQGVQGTQGIQGVQGTQGIQGIQGPQGVQGNVGIQGIQGIQGPQGVQGNVGIQGIQGITGAQGVQGNVGIQGIQGITGAQGVQGNVGIQGTQGITGAQGVQGNVGIQGTQGITGTQGIQGITGTQGVTGAQGITGAQGVQGPTGPGIVNRAYTASFSNSGTVLQNAVSILNQTLLANAKYLVVFSGTLRRGDNENAGTFRSRSYYIQSSGGFPINLESDSTGSNAYHTFFLNTSDSRSYIQRRVIEMGSTSIAYDFYLQTAAHTGGTIIIDNPTITITRIS